MKKISFNSGWSFCRKGFTNAEHITLPHDAMIHQPRSPQNPSGSAQAFFPGGEYVYEKTFSVPAEWGGQTALLQFEGVYKHARVFVNGKEAGGAAYGYIPFFIPLDGLLNYGEENVLRVECENRDQPDSRWYTGAGIYRPVWLWTGPKDAILPESVKISTVSYDPAVIRITSPLSVRVEVEGVTGEGTDFQLAIPNARLWSEDTPNLYTAHVTHGEDSEDITFGIRKVEWSASGLFVNGRPTLLRGGCVHHDSGILGAATYDKSDYRRVKKLKEAGYNAIRSSHNPASRAMLDACDKLGVYVMDETWDMWYSHKNKYDYAGHFMANYKDDIKAMVDRDFNHPSVILYSIANEVSEPAQEKGIALAREMVDYIHSLDATRAVTGGFNLMIIANSKKGKGVYDEGGGRSDDKDKAMQGMNSTLFNFITNMVGTGMNKSANSKKADEATAPLLDSLDLAGYNYASGRYPLEGKAHPGRLIFGSETFPQDIWKNWQMVKQYPYLVGDFMWTAWDYLGEAGLGAWGYTPDSKGFNKPYPWLLADCGVFDILGNPTAELYLAQAAWERLDKPAIAVQPVNHPGVKPAKMVWRGTNALPSWSWQGCEGNKTMVEVYTTADQVELRLNGTSIGKKKVKEGLASFRVKYASGTLEAVALDSVGRELGRGQLRSAAGPLQICVEPEEKAVQTGEIVYVPISLKAENGEVEANADRELTVTVKGGKLLAFGSANPRTEKQFDSGSYTTYYGYALAVVQAGEKGIVSVSVTDGKQSGTAEITIKDG